MQAEDNEDLSSQEDTIDFFEENNGGFLDLFNESKEEVTKEDIIAIDSEEIANVAEGLPSKKRLKTTTHILSTMKLKLVPQNKTLVYERRNGYGKKGRGRRKVR